MPKDQRERISREIREVQWSPTGLRPEDGLRLSCRSAKRPSQPAFVVEIKVDAQGNSVPVSLWINRKNYKF